MERGWPGRRVRGRVLMKWDVSDPGHRAALIAARSWGVSPSRFLGEEPVTVFTHTEYGQMVSSQPGPEWTDDDRDAAIALMTWESTLCPGCRQPLEETTKAENETRYRTELPIRCHYCTASEIGQESAQSHPHPGALLIPVSLRE